MGCPDIIRTTSFAYFTGELEVKDPTIKRRGKLGWFKNTKREKEITKKVRKWEKEMWG